MELQPWILREDYFNKYALKKKTLCQRTVYLTVLTLRALLNPTPYTVHWEASDYNGVGAHIYLVNKRNGSKTELAEIVCFNDRLFVWRVRMEQNRFTGDAEEFNGPKAAEGLQHLLVSVARFAQSRIEQIEQVQLPFVGSYNPDELNKLIKTSGEYRGGACFISDKDIDTHYRRRSGNSAQ